MMLLTPLGLLGLLSIVVLIIIYIIKPNYQQKFISSTFVWKLSLKYRKKKIPISKLRNILLIICQILIFALSAVILAQPNLILQEQIDSAEVILIIDSSASMRTELEGETRYERAVDQVIDQTKEVFGKGGIVSVVLADSKAAFLAERATAENKNELYATLNSLLEGEDIACSYGASDMDGAILLCEEVLFVNPEAKIYLYTDTRYSYVPEGIEVKNVSGEEEWNAAILNAYTELMEGYFTFYVDVACYGVDREIEVRLEVQNANADSSDDVGGKLVFEGTVPCNAEKTKTLVFINEDLYKQEADAENFVYVKIPNNDQEDKRVYSYQTVHISIDQDDSFKTDNNFQIYNGQKEIVKIQYASSDPNPFFAAALGSLRNRYSDRWDIRITEVKKDDTEAVKTEGFDFYIFEHELIPETMPTDGVVILADPYTAPTGSGILRIGSMYDILGSATLIAGDTHPILEGIQADSIEVSRYTEIAYGSGFETLLYCNSKPVVTVRNDSDAKVVVMGFSLHYSTLVLRKDFPLLMYNIFGYFMPTTVSGNSFEVNEKVELNARGETLTVQREGSSEDGQTFTSFPASLQVTLPGTYSLKQTTFADKAITEYIYVRIPAEESNIWKTEDALKRPERTQDHIDYFEDLLFYVAITVAALLFIEWWLQSRENM